MLERLTLDTQTGTKERDPDAGVHREPTVLSSEHIASRVGIDEPLHAEPPHDTTAHLLGERCGNADLISVVVNLAVKLPGYTVLAGSGTAHLTELSRFVYETANMTYRPGQPFVGASAFAHKGGMHVHAVAKATESYEHIPPEAVGNSRRILVSELSGRSNIAALVTRPDVKNDRALLDYKVRGINAQEGSAAKVRVSIESTDGESVWGTVGVSENLIEASWLALADSFHYVLSK